MRRKSVPPPPCLFRNCVRIELSYKEQHKDNNNKNTTIEWSQEAGGRGGRKTLVIVGGRGGGRRQRRRRRRGGRSCQLGDSGELPDNYIGLGDEFNSDDNNVKDDDKNDVAVPLCCIFQGQVWGAFEVYPFIHWHLHLCVWKEARFDPTLPCPVPCPA